MFKTLYAKWKSRKKYAAFVEMPDALVSLFALSGFLVAGFFGYVLSKAVPAYLEIANKVPLNQWGVKGWAVSVILAVMGFMTWHFGSVCWRCNGILRDRWYK